jgi:hypothetical protein
MKLSSFDALTEYKHMLLAADKERKRKDSNFSLSAHALKMRDQLSGLVETFRDIAFRTRG